MLSYRKMNVPSFKNYFSCSPNSYIAIVIENFQINVSEAPILLIHVVIFNWRISVILRS